MIVPPTPMSDDSPTSVPFQDLPQQIRSLRSELDAAIGKVLDHGRFILGEEVTCFEKKWAEYCGTKHAIGVGSGTDALHLILRALGIGPGDEVITVANTFIATAEAISYTGAAPVLVDCDKTYGLIDPTAVESAITARTRAIIPVHLYGQPANWPALQQISAHHTIPLIEDAAQAHGATLVDGRRCGSLGLAAGFSFYPGKNLGAFGDAGAITTNCDTLAAKVRLLRNWGSTIKYHHDVAGYNSRLDTLQAAVLSTKLPHLDKWTGLRNQVVSKYREALKNTQIRVIAKAPWTGTHAYHLLVVQLPQNLRDHVAKTLASSGIQTVIHYPIPIHRQPAYHHLQIPAGALPNAESLSTEILSLPLFPEITEQQIDHVATCLSQAIAHTPRR